VRLARAGCGGVNYWMELPVSEVVNFMVELADQVTEENEAIERATKRR
jgi:hypothetical protein